MAQWPPLNTPLHTCIKHQILSATLDRTKISDRKAMMVLPATAQSLGYDLEEIELYQSWLIRRFRQQYLTTDAKKLKEAFNADNPLVIH